MCADLGRTVVSLAWVTGDPHDRGDVDNASLALLAHHFSSRLRHHASASHPRLDDGGETC